VNLQPAQTAPTLFPIPDPDVAASSDYGHLVECDLLVVEDVQYLPARANAMLATVLEERARRRLATVLTANAGPARLNSRASPLPARLVSRLAAGLVLRLAPMPGHARRALLEQRVRDEGLHLEADALDWLAQRLRGARQVIGIVERLRLLAHLKGSSLDSSGVMTALADLNETSRVSLDRIVQHVCRFFEVDPRPLRSSRRNLAVLRPRQVSIYLARELTGLSLEQIGACFGSRDHSTVLHAFRKVQHDLAHDAQLAGALRELTSELV
jgi:chromosomal replication initiator protein